MSLSTSESAITPPDEREMIIVMTTITDIERAKILAHQVISEHLAACCNIIPGVSSIYRWQGELHEEQECLLVMKTIKSRYSTLDKYIRSHHPYEVPELLALPVTECFEKYLSWIVKETT